MTGQGHAPATRGLVLVNLQKRHVVRTRAVLSFACALRRRLRLGKRKFNICLVDDNAIRRLNLAYRGKDKATDVLSFGWNDSEPAPVSQKARHQGYRGPLGITNFMGEVVISVPTASVNAAGEGHSTLNEIRWLIIHGVLHLLGYDHENDSGEMIDLELTLREELGVAGALPRKQRLGMNMPKGKD